MNHYKKGMWIFCFLFLAFQWGAYSLSEHSENSFEEAEEWKKTMFTKYHFMPQDPDKDFFQEDFKTVLKNFSASPQDRNVFEEFMKKTHSYIGLTAQDIQEKSEKFRKANIANKISIIFKNLTVFEQEEFCVGVIDKEEKDECGTIEKLNIIMGDQWFNPTGCTKLKV